MPTWAACCREPALAWGWTRWSLQVPSNPSNPVLLWQPAFCLQKKLFGVLSPQNGAGRMPGPSPAEQHHPKPSARGTRPHVPLPASLRALGQLLGKRELTAKQRSCLSTENRRRKREGRCTLSGTRMHTWFMQGFIPAAARGAEPCSHAPRVSHIAVLSPGLLNSCKKWGGRVRTPKYCPVAAAIPQRLHPGGAEPHGAPGFEPCSSGRRRREGCPFPRGYLP